MVTDQPGGSMVTVNCIVCGKEESVYPARSEKYKTCSKECLGKLNAERYSQKVNTSCCMCGKEMNIKPSHLKRRKCCSKKCDNRRRENMYAGEGNPNYGNRQEKAAPWKGGRRVSNYGYILLHMPDHPMARPDGYILEHRLVMSEYLGRLLEKDEDIHHIDGNKKNNDPNNLELMTRSEHMRLHHAIRKGNN